MSGLKNKAEQKKKAAKAAQAKKEEKGDAEDEGDDVSEEDTATAPAAMDSGSSEITPDVITKYRKAAEIADGALKHVSLLVVPGASVLALCEAGDAYVAAEMDKVYKKDKQMTKGLAFPTCVSPNHFVGHVCPIKDEDMTIKAGDLVKIDLGVHVDGYIAVAATTIALPEEGASTVTGRKADVMHACATAAAAAMRLLKIGKKNGEVTDVIGRSATAFKCEPVMGVLSHQMSRFLIDGEKVIIGKTDLEQKVDEITFEPNEVYAIDIVMTTGEGKPRETDVRTTVYKKEADTVYALKMKASRAILSEINQNCPTFPFTIRALDQGKVRFGIVECANHKLVAPYPVLTEKEGEFVAHLKYTVLITNSGTLKISGLDLDLSNCATEHKNEDKELAAVLQQSAGKKKNKPKKKKKAGEKEEPEEAE